MKTSPLVFKLPQSTSVNMVSVAICYFGFAPDFSLFGNRGCKVFFKKQQLPASFGLICVLSSDYSPQLVQIPHAVATAIAGDFIEYAHCGRRVDEVGGADLHSRGSGHDELESVASGGDAAKSDYRDADGFRHLPHHPDRYRAYAWAGEASGNGA